MTAENSSDISGLTAVLNARLSSAAVRTRAVGFVWLCAGAACALMLAGAGAAAALYGYSSVLSVEPAAEQTAKALVDAFRNATVQTTVSGTMALARNSEVKLAAGQVVRLAEGSSVPIDPTSTIRVVGNLKVDIPQPSREQLQLETTADGQMPPFTEYVIFKSVDFGAGEVVTGWEFEVAEPIRPKYQFCYYLEKLAKGLSIKQMLAHNASPERPPSSPKLTFDFDGAVANCIWYSGI